MTRTACGAASGRRSQDGPTPSPLPIDHLERALEVIAYELERRPEQYGVADPISALERARVAAESLPSEGAALREVYPALVELAVRSLAALGTMPEPGEVDGLLDYGGIDLWRRTR